MKVDPDSTPLVIVEHRGRAGLEHLEPDWRRLYAAMPARSRCHACETHRAYLDHLCAEPERVRYLALVDTGPGAANGAAGAAANGGANIRAICPLEPIVDPSLRLPLRAWALPSHYHWLATDVIAADTEACQALLPAVTAHLRRGRQGRGLLLLGPMRADLELSGAAAQLPPRSVCLHDTHPSALFDTTVPYAQLMERMSKHFRRNLRSHHKKLQAAGHIELLTFSGAVDPAGLATEFEAFLSIEESGWKGREGAGSAIRLRPRLVAFYKQLMTTMTGPEDHCEINSLHLDGRCIAAQFCMRAGAEYTILKIAYDEEFARLGPGQVLFQSTMERCSTDSGISYIDLVTDAPWMRDWHTELLPMQQAHIALSPLRSAPLMAALRFRHGPARRLVQKYRETSRS